MNRPDCGTYCAAREEADRLAGELVQAQALAESQEGKLVDAEEERFHLRAALAKAVVCAEKHSRGCRCGAEAARKVLGTEIRPSFVGVDLAAPGGDRTVVVRPDGSHSDDPDLVRRIDEAVERHLAAEAGPNVIPFRRRPSR